MNSIFENSGKIIKKIAVIFFYIGLIASAICAYAFGKNNWGDFNFWLFIIYLIGGIASSFISSICLYAFGDIADNVKKMATMEKKMEEKEVSEKSRLLSSYGEPIGRHAEKNIETWVCKKCGTRNPKSTTYCKDCGAYK